jgi:predicted Rossmann-fold nucleotide-binding protein
VALPGGLGTLDEVFTVAAAATIGYHQRPVILYNMDGFWQPLVQLLSSMQDSGVIRGTWTDYIFLVNSLAELKDKLGN